MCAIEKVRMIVMFKVLDCEWLTYIICKQKLMSTCLVKAEKVEKISFKKRGKR